MKCSYCGNELEKGADFCPECGMILGLNDTREEKKSEAAEPEFKVPEYTPNVFNAGDVEEEENVPAMELESDGKEEVAPVTENIPEYVSQVPEYTPVEFEDISSDVAAEEEKEEVQEESAEEEKAAEAEEELAAPEYVPAPDMPDEDELSIRVPEGEITYPEYEKYKNAQAENEVINPTEEEYEEIDSDDIYVDPGKKKNGVLTVFLVIALICIIVGGVYAVKNVLPTLGGDKEETTTEAVQAGADETTEEESTSAAEEETTEEESTSAEDETTAEETTEEESSEAETEAEETEESEEADTTTTAAAVTTTKPSTTAPATTRPATTKPSATKPATTTDPYGINDVTVKKPSKMNGKTYTVYCTAEGVILRSAASKSSERVLYLSISYSVCRPGR